MSNPFPPAAEVAREAYENHERRRPVRLAQIQNLVNDCIRLAKEDGLPLTKVEWPGDCDTTLYYDQLRQELEEADYEVRLEGPWGAQTLTVSWVQHGPYGLKKEPHI